MGVARHHDLARCKVKPVGWIVLSAIAANVIFWGGFELGRSDRDESQARESCHKAGGSLVRNSSGLLACVKTQPFEMLP